MRASLFFVALLVLLATAVDAASHSSHHTAPHHKVHAPHANKYEHLKLASLKSTDSPLYNVSRAYVLGLSSGGFLAVQMSVAYSSEFSGAGIFAAGPYYCAQGSLSTAMTQCVNALSPINLGSLELTTAYFAATGAIDGLGNLTSQPIYLFHGQSDRTVFATVNQALYQMYVDFHADVKFNNLTSANHAWISPTGPNECAVSQSPYISNCGMDVEKELLTHMMQSEPAQASSEPQGKVYSFSQDTYAEDLFATTASSYSMDSTGYIYMPPSCANGAECDLLVVLHGCLQGYSSVGSALIEDSNLNVYADTNNYIVLYPQAIASTLMGNPESCWDWWGYSTPGNSSLYAQRGAPQMEIVRAIMKGLGFQPEEQARRKAANLAAAAAKKKMGNDDVIELM